MHSENPARGALLLTISALAFAAMGAVIKIVSAELPNEMIVFSRNAMGLIALTPWLLRTGRSGVRTPCFRMHLTRALVGLAGMYCFFYAIGHLPLAEAMLLNYSAPLFIPFIAFLWLGERLPRFFGWAISLGFVGIAMILKPGMILFSPAALVGVAAGVLTAVAFVSIRRLALREPTARIVFYFGTISTVISAVPLVWSWKTPAAGLWNLLVGMGILATGGQLLMTRAYALAPAARIGPFSYGTVVFSAALGWAIWGEVPDRFSMLGAVLVCTAGVIAVRSMEMTAETIVEKPLAEAIG